MPLINLILPAFQIRRRAAATVAGEHAADRRRVDRHDQHAAGRRQQSEVLTHPLVALIEELGRLEDEPGAHHPARQRRARRERPQVRHSPVIGRVRSGWRNGGGGLGH